MTTSAIRWPAEAIWEAVSPLLPGFTVEVLPTIDSTNTELMRRARSGRCEPTLLVAEQQTAGRGRLGRVWQSDVGASLMLSLGLPLAPKDWSGLSLAVGVSVAESLQPVLPPQGASHPARVGLKWPNDLWLGGAGGDRKLGGILVETASFVAPQATAPSPAGASAARYVVVGIGINVHQSGFAADLATPATSLDLAAGRTISRQALLIALLKSLEREAFLLAQLAALAGIPARVEAASTWMRGRSVDVHGPQACTGVTDGLDANGFLRVRTAQGLTVVQTGGMRAKETD